MRIKIWASDNPAFPDVGPYKSLDTVQKDALYAVGDQTHYGEVIAIPPSIMPFIDDVDQSVIVKLNPFSLTSIPNESVLERPPTSYDNIEFFPIHTHRFGGLNPDSLTEDIYPILTAENLTIENVSHLITPDTFAGWNRDGYVAKRTIDALQGIRYAIVHRYSSRTIRDDVHHKHADEMIDLTVACLALIRPTRSSRAGKITGLINHDGMFHAQGFSSQEPVEVPEIQKLFSIGHQDIELLHSILPEFIQLYRRNDSGQMTEDYEPIRMAVQLYTQAYAIPYWKARHILWWAAIEALFGNDKGTAMARIYAMFGNKNPEDGYRCSIYEDGDIPSWFPQSPRGKATLGELLPIICDVRDMSAHGSRVTDQHFTAVPHPLGTSVSLIDVLAEAATFIIRKTIINILRRSLREDFKDRKSRENFWLFEYGLNGKQSKKRLAALNSLNLKS